MMIPTVKLMLVLATALAVLVTTIDASINKGKNTGNQKSVNDKLELELRNAAQNALKAIGSTRIPTASYERAKRDQHVFNNGLLKIHRNVLEDLLKDVAPDFYHEQMENLMNDFMIPLNQPQQHAISTMKAHFRSDEFYVDFNADVYGEYVRELRKALVGFLKADTSVTINERKGIENMRQWVLFIAGQMVIHEVYVDPMARDRWLQENTKDHVLYYEVRDALKKRFLFILQDIKIVSERIRVFLWEKN